MTSGCIAFSGEAHDSAAAAFRQLEGWTVMVTTTGDESYDAQLGEVRIDSGNGQYVIGLRRVDEAGEPIAGTDAVLDLYDDIARVEVY